MHANEIKELYEAEPFQPFEIILPNGSAVLVDHPEFMAFSRDFRTVYVSKRDGGTQFIDTKLITSLNLLPPRSSKRSRKQS